MKEDLVDIPLPDRLSERVRTICDLAKAPSTLEEFVTAWLERGCSTQPADLVHSEQTPHRVDAAGHVRYAWCALDAMILAILEKNKLDLQTTDPETGNVIEMRLDPAEPPVCRDGGQEPVLAFGFASTGFVDLKRSCCPYVNLFESAQSYRRWSERSAEATTMPLSIEQASRLAHRWARAMAAANFPEPDPISRHPGCCDV